MTATRTRPRPRPLVLVILDGFGERAERADNAVRLARTPVLSSLEKGYPHGLIGASGPDVGLPPGQMGNSEVGHLNFGAGRFALLDITRIAAELEAGMLGKNEVLRDLTARAARSGGAPPVPRAVGRRLVTARPGPRLALPRTAGAALRLAWRTGGVWPGFCRYCA